MSLSKSLVEKYKPVIYVPKEPKNAQLIDVLLEIFSTYAILWYHWPFDDYSGKEDYEPVILVFKNDLLIRIGIRPHEKHDYYNSWVTENGKPVIVFTTPWHGPNISRGGLKDSLSGAFAYLVSDKIIDYELTNSKPPIWYIKDGTDIEIYDYAEQIARIS